MRIFAFFLGISLTLSAFAVPPHCPDPFVFKMITSLPEGWNPYPVADAVREGLVASDCKSQLIFDEPEFMKDCRDANEKPEKCKTDLDAELLEISKKYGDKLKLVSATVTKEDGRAPLNARLEVKVIGYVNGKRKVERENQRFALYTPGDLLAPIRTATRIVMHDPSLGCNAYAGGKCMVCTTLLRGTCPNLPQNKVPFAYSCSQNPVMAELSCIGMPPLNEPGSSIIARGSLNAGVSTWDSNVMGRPGEFAIKVELFMKAQGQVVEKYETGVTGPGSSKFQIYPFATVTPDVNGDVKVGLYAQNCWRNDHGHCDLSAAELGVFPHLRICYRGPGVTDCDGKPPATKIVKHR